MKYKETTSQLLNEKMKNNPYYYPIMTPMTFLAFTVIHAGALYIYTRALGSSTRLVVPSFILRPGRGCGSL